MAASHHSYNRIGLGSPETDRLVRIAWELGRTREPGTNGRPAAGVYGAKITGGGSGGTVALLVYGNGGDKLVREAAETYTRETGNPARIFGGGASPGALAFGHREVDLA
jgi:L-arabinokinase